MDMRAFAIASFTCFLVIMASARCPFRKSCASGFWAHQRVKSWACVLHVV